MIRVDRRDGDAGRLLPIGCDNAVNYTDAILRDVLTKGIADPEIQPDLLRDKNQDMSLEEVFKFVEAKESGKRSASQLWIPTRLRQPAVHTGKPKL